MTRWNSFHTVMNNGLRRLMKSIMGLLSFTQDEYLSSEQPNLIHTITMTSDILYVLINYLMDTHQKTMLYVYLR